MAWIESHQALAHHPKTLRLTKELHCGIPAAIGYLHLMWWWCIDYAPEGRVSREVCTTLARACHYRGSSTRFCNAMLSAGFFDQAEGSSDLLVHDWREYAGRLVERRQKDAERKRDFRRTSAGRPAYRTNTTNHVVVGELKAPGPRAHDPGPGGPVTRADPEPLGNGAQQCPICREVFTSTYLEHTSERHKVRQEPEDFKGKRRPYDGQLLPEVNGPLVPTQELAEEHERLLARERAKHG